MIAGFDVAHVHLHVVPLEAPRDLDYDSQRMDVTEAELDEARSRILASLSAS
jgi:histidine triad (HIT) family protein